jgi:putative endonuclease
MSLFSWLERKAAAPHLEAGRRAEDAVLAYLQERGLRLVERNYRCRQGEIDLTMRDGSTLVFVEVRYRADSRRGGALASVDARKQAKLIAAARHYLAARRVDSVVRFDAAAVEPAGGSLSIRWIKDAFRVN